MTRLTTFVCALAMLSLFAVPADFASAQDAAAPAPPALTVPSLSGVDNPSATVAPVEAAVESAIEAQEAAAAAETAASEAFGTVDGLASASGLSVALDGTFAVFAVLLMAGLGLGLTLLQGGLIRPINVAAQTVNAIGLCGFAGIAYVLIGYPLMYGGEGGGFTALVESGYNILGPTSLNAAHNALSIQTLIAVVAALMVAGAVVERVRFWPMVLFAGVFAATIYPVQGSWLWGSGWLLEEGVSLTAGASLNVHTAVGWAALAGILVVGARRGKYAPDGRIARLERASMPLAALGAFLVALGLPILNDVALASESGVAGFARGYHMIQNISFQSLGLAAACAVATGALFSQILYRRINGPVLLLAGLGGIVSVNFVMIPHYSLIGIGVAAAGGALVVLSGALMELLRLDDPVGVIPVHLVCGIWGTMAAAFVGGDAVDQLLGVAAVGAFVFISSMVLWLALKFTVGLRGSEAEELLGFNQADQIV